MPRRQAIGLCEVAAFDNLCAAFQRAARGKRRRPEVQEFERDLERRIESLRCDILGSALEVGCARRFVIHDPKRRVIHAPVFRERVLHHALIACMEPTFERSHVFDTYACRPGKGSLAAARRVGAHLRRHPWYVQVDVRRFFDSVDHRRLAEMLARRFKNARLLELCRRIIGAYATERGKGLPIGALTSQHFANFYLARLDRFSLESLGVRAMVRYMDDVILWTGTRAEAREALARLRSFASSDLCLELKTSAQVQPSSRGATFCGFRIQANTLRLSARRKRRYSVGRRILEAAYAARWIDSDDLQRGFSSVLAVTAHADAAGWRRDELRRGGAVSC
ncbi:MAG: RNA-dependent DNA polymerase [bacterium]|nr:RNA-dependent DNA polymerase [bacterium]